MALPPIFDYLRPVSTATGLLTAVVLLGVGVDMAYNHHWSAVVTLGSFVIMCVLEVTSVPEACFHSRLSTSAQAPLPWSVIGRIRDGKRGLLYCCLAILVLVTSQHRMWLTALAGALLFICATEQCLLAYVEWRGTRRRDRTCLLEDDDFGHGDEESPERESSEDILRQARPEQI